jgi:hypothetical protein
MAIYVATRFQKEQYASELIAKFGNKATDVIVEMLRVMPQGSDYNDLVKVMDIIMKSNPK